MNKGILLHAILCLLLFSFLVQAEVPEKFGYITVTGMNITLKEGFAELHLDYEIDDGMRILALLFGNADLKTKIIDMLGFYDAEIESVDLDSADIVISDLEVIYGEGLYWFPPHQFQVTVPELTIITPQDRITYSRVTGIPDGICYYRETVINGTPVHDT
ncbi:MAG: hypothetical protein JXA44_13010 [Methanospirillaceae archaeon]|nr:hypothetical protein [Methanospirillaceae archaeon]